MCDALGRIDHSKANGDLIITGPEGNVILESPTMKCCHCGVVWIVINKSKRKRGFCLKCMNVTCGNEKCDNCTPLEKVLGYA